MTFQASPAVAAALAEGGAVVALESTLITHGFSYPVNLDVARAAEAAVRKAGAEPATVAIYGGSVRVGMSDAELEEMALSTGALKASRQNLALALQSGGWAGTTVSATMICARLAGIRVFATGGIGGVHRGGERTMDISADLEELARTPVLVVCSGPKSILDVGLTLEYLETRGVPVVGWRTRRLAGFYSRDSGRELGGAVDGPEAAAELAQAHWSLGMESGLVVAVPVPEAVALPMSEADDAIAHAVAEADEGGIRGAGSTPWILARIAELTGGRSGTANQGLIENNAGVAGAVAVAMAAAFTDATRPGA